MTSSFLIVAALLIPAQPADTPRTTFLEAKHGQSELKIHQGIPVLQLRGTPQEVGEAIGILAVQNSPEIEAVFQRFLKDVKQADRVPLLMLSANRLKANMPADYRTELEAAAKSSGKEMKLFLLANMIADISSGLGCSTLIVDKERSATGEMLFGRNFDWFPTKGLTEHTIVAVYHPKDKHAFATVTYAGMNGVLSGMNDAGLCVTINEIHLRQSADKAGFNWAGMPLLSLYRKVMEECKTVDEAVALMRKTPSTTSACMTICDTVGGGVIEFTPKTVFLRRGASGICCCTNHFQSDTLCVDGEADKCWRLPKLEAVQKSQEKLGVKEVYKHLHEVNQKRATLQSMVFEPKARVLNLKLGEVASAKKEAVRLELGPWLAK